ELARDLRQQHRLDRVHRGRAAEVLHRGHAQALVAAGIDPVERLQVHADVERQAMEAASAAHADAQRRDLGPAHVHAGRALQALATDVPLVERVDDRLLDPAHVLAHAHADPAQVQQRVEHDLARAVVGHLAAAVHVQHRDVARRQHVLRLAGLAQGEHRLVLDQPQLVRRVLATGIGEALHRPPHRLVSLAAEVEHPRRARRARRGGRGLAGAHRVHFTSGWSRRAWWARSYCPRLSARKPMRTDTYLPLEECFHWMLSSRTSTPAAASSFGSSVSRPLSAAPMALSSKVPGNWKPCSGLSDLISIDALSGPGPPNPGTTPAQRCGAAMHAPCTPARGPIWLPPFRRNPPMPATARMRSTRVLSAALLLLSPALAAAQQCDSSVLSETPPAVNFRVDNDLLGGEKQDQG